MTYAKKLAIGFVLGLALACSGGKKKGLILFPTSLGQASESTVAVTTVEDTSDSAATQGSQNDVALLGVLTGDNDACTLAGNSGSSSGSSSNSGSSSGDNSSSGSSSSGSSSSSSSGSSSGFDSGSSSSGSSSGSSTDDPYVPVSELCHASPAYHKIPKGGNNTVKETVDLGEYDLSMDAANCLTGKFKIAVDFNITGTLPKNGASFHVKIKDLLGRQIGFINLQAKTACVLKADGHITLNEPNQTILFVWEGSSEGRADKASSTASSLEISGITLSAKRSQMSSGLAGFFGQSAQNRALIWTIHGRDSWDSGILGNSQSDGDLIIQSVHEAAAENPRLYLFLSYKIVSQ